MGWQMKLKCYAGEFTKRVREMFSQLFVTLCTQTAETTSPEPFSWIIQYLEGSLTIYYYVLCTLCGSYKAVYLLPNVSFKRFPQLTGPDCGLWWIIKRVYTEGYFSWNQQNPNEIWKKRYICLIFFRKSGKISWKVGKLHFPLPSEMNQIKNGQLKTFLWGYDIKTMRFG